MSEIRIENAKIRSTMLGIEDHGILTCMVHLEGESWGCGFGGFALDEPFHESGKFVGRRGTGYGMEFIRRVLSTLEIDSWEKLPGTIVRCKTEGWGGQTRALGHAIKDRWFEPKIDLAEFAK